MDSVVKLAVAALWLLPMVSEARVKELSLEIRKIETLRHAYYPEKDDFFGYVGLNWAIENKKQWLYWDNTVAFYGDKSQVRHIFWEYRVGLKATKWLDIFYYHKSEHTADANRDDIGHPSKFPLQNSIGVKIDMK